MTTNGGFFCPFCLNTIFSAYPSEPPDWRPQFDCIMAGFDSDHEWAYTVGSNENNWQTSESGRPLFIETANEILADRNKEDLTPGEINAIEREASEQLWGGWLANGYMPIFGLPPDPAEAWEEIEEACRDEECIDPEECCEEGDPECTPECIDPEDCDEEQCIEEKPNGNGNGNGDCITESELEWDYLYESSCDGPLECDEFEREDHIDDGIVGKVDYDQTVLRWNNIPFAFAETNMATDGFSNWGPSTPTPYISLSKTREVFQAMAGMPETEFLYINVGGREGAFDVTYTWHRIIWQFGIWWIESDCYPLFCEYGEEEQCGPLCGTPAGWDEDGNPIPCGVAT